MEILKVHDLCKTYGKGEAEVEALKKVSFSLDKGEFAAIVGESGSGKSTLLNCIGALDAPSSGKIWPCSGYGGWGWQDFGGWTRPVFYERGTTHNFPSP